MSSNASPEETPVDSPPESGAGAGDGGNSKHLTQGEIIFVTLLSFVIVVVIVWGAYEFHRRRKRQQTDQKEDEQRRASAEGLDMEITVTDPEIKGLTNGGDAENKAMRENPGSQAWDGNRRGTLESNDSDAKMNRGSSRRASWESNGSEGKMGRNGSRRGSMDSGPNRRSTLGSVGSNVSSNYKLAAIDHMNQISQAGRHD